MQQHQYLFETIWIAFKVVMYLRNLKRIYPNVNMTPKMH
jgi:hypothetical protein